MIVSVLDSTTILWIGACCVVVYVLTHAIYQLYFSPLAKFPGPKLAAITRWYEFYYEVILGGRYIFKIRELHEEYGPIIRVTPYELHVSDAEFYETLFSNSGRREKYDWIRVRFGNADAISNTSSHELHRIRRSPLLPMFSKQQIINFEPHIQEKVDVFHRILRQYEKDGSVMALDRAAAAVTGDIMSEFAFAKSFNTLESKDFSESLFDTIMASVRSAHVLPQFQWLMPLLNLLPLNVVAKLQPNIAQLFHIGKVLSEECEDIRHGRNEGYKTADHPTIFRRLLDSDLPESERRPDRITQEAKSLIGAGIATNAWTICVGCVHILSNPQIELKLRSELRQAIPLSSESLSWVELERLPYLKACIYESLRLSYGVVSRLQRIAPDETVHYKQWAIPPGTPVSQSHLIVNHDEAIFPDSHSFRPERWIEGGIKMEKYLFSFSKGTRICLGINLAYSELFKIMALLFRCVEMRLYETDLTDIECRHDYFIPIAKNDSKGVRVEILKVE